MQKGDSYQISENTDIYRPKTDKPVTSGR